MTTYHGCTPRWSADGQRIYFAHHDPKYNGAIVLWSIKADGTDAKRFETPTRKRWGGYDPICESPDGKMVTYSGGGVICVMRISDGAEVKLTQKQGKSQDMAPRWHRGPE
jgi:Tol biopolymer transport system component